MYLRSDYYTNDERWEVTGHQGYARVNRCTGRGIQQPSLDVYADGEMRSYHALDDDWASSFRDSGRHWLRWLRSGEGPLLWSGDEAVERPAIRIGCLRQQCRRRHRCRPALALIATQCFKAPGHQGIHQGTRARTRLLVMPRGEPFTYSSPIKDAWITGMGTDSRQYCSGTLASRRSASMWSCSNGAICVL
jgi:hypothetical protein